MTFFAAPHPLVPVAQFSVATAGPAALEEHATARSSPSSPSRPPPPATAPPQLPSLLPLATQPQQLGGGASGYAAVPTYSLFPSSRAPGEDQPGASDYDYSLFSTGSAESPVDSAMPPGLDTVDSALPPGLDSGFLDAAPDFLGRLDHMKTLFRMSATKEPVSMMIHRVGPLLILDNGPQGWSHGESGHPLPLPPPGLEHPDLDCEHGARDAEPQLMLAALDASLQASFMGAAEPEASSMEPPVFGQPPGLLAQAPSSELAQRLIVKNTFLDVAPEEQDEEDLSVHTRTHSAPGRIGAVMPASPTSDGEMSCEGGAWSLPMAPMVQQAMLQHASSGETLSSSSCAPPPSTAASSWSLVRSPLSQPQRSPSTEPGSDLSKLCGNRQLDLLQLASKQKSEYRTLDCRTLEAMRSLFAGTQPIPPQPSRMGRAVEWRCGPYKILLGCDLVVFRSEEQVDVSKFASFKMLPPGGASEPSREERLDVYLENLMCNINTAVWGSHNQGQTNWRVINTQDLPAAETGEDDQQFDSDALLDQGRRLLHFLRQQCRREGGTYWLFREQNSPNAELFDLRCNEGKPPGSPDTESDKNSPFATTDSLVLPIASLCVHLAKAATNAAEQRQLLQKAFSLLEPLKEEHPGLYSSVALQLARSYMSASHNALPDSASTAASSTAEPPAAARLSVALRYLETLLSILTSPDDGAEDDMDMADVALRAEILLQAHVAYAECIVKLVKEAFVPVYSAWLAEVQRSTQEMMQKGGPSCKDMIDEMKRLSAAFLLWRIFWLVRAQRALDFVPREKRETECWILERDLHETMGDALYGLSRYPADDADNLLAGQMGTSEGICSLVSEGLRSWGLRGGTQCLAKASISETKRKAHKNHGKKKSKGVVSPNCSGSEDADTQPHNVNAMFLSKLNPLTRGFCDEAVREDRLVRDELHPTLWSEGVAFKTSLALFERAAARLRKAWKDSGGTRIPSDDQATLKIARKLAHLYNEEARAALVGADDAGTEGVEELLNQAHEWMLLSGDTSNASRVLLNLSELYARRAELQAAAKGDDGEAFPLSEPQYKLWLQAIECCEEAASLSDKSLGLREGAFAHLRVGVHLLTRVPYQLHLVDAARREDTLAELSDRHFSKALRGFDELKEEREVAVCHFHMADLALQELRIPGAAALPKARLVSALRHARRSADYWERMGCLLYAKDFISAHVRTARLLEHQQRSATAQEALEHLATVEEKLLVLARGAKPAEMSSDKDLFVVEGETFKAVVPLRREMGRVCQAGLRLGSDVERLKKIYRLILRNEPVTFNSASAA